MNKRTHNPLIDNRHGLAAKKSVTPALNPKPWKTKEMAQLLSRLLYKSAAGSVGMSNCWCRAWGLGFRLKS